MQGAGFCSECGKKIEGDSAFCPECGSSIGSDGGYPRFDTDHVENPEDSRMSAEGAIEALEGNAHTDGNTGDAGGNSLKTGGKGRIVAIVVAVIAAISIIVVCLVLFVPVVPQQDGSADLQAEEAEQLVSDDELETRSADEDEESDAQSDASLEEYYSSDSGSTTHNPSSINDELSINNADDRFLVNRYLSNFSEIGTIMNGYTSRYANPSILVYFGMAHTEFNYPSEFIYISDSTSPYFGTYRVSFDLVDKYATMFLKKELTANDANTQFSTYSDGYVYGYVEDGAPYMSGITYSDKIVKIADNQYRVDFRIYGPTYYEVTDEAYYRMTESQLQSMFVYQTSGNAVIETGYSDDTAPFNLISYTLDL